MPPEQRRSAERITLPAPIEATLGDVPVRLVEISLINCRVEHTAKVPMGYGVVLQFQFHGARIRLKGRVTRSEMRTVGGQLGYISALEFTKSLEDAPEPLRRLVATLLGEPEEPPKPPTPPPPPAAEIEEIDASEEIPPKHYVECVLNEGKWTIREVTDPKQPAEGFTMIVPESDREIRETCRTYEVADAETRRMIRLAFELAIARKRG